MVTITLAFFPLALVTLAIEDLQLFSVNLAFVADFGAIYAASIYFDSEKYSFQLWEVVALGGVYLVQLGGD